MVSSNISHAPSSISRQYLTPKEVLHTLIQMGIHKAHTPIWKTLVGSFYAGMGVVFGGMIAVSTAGGINATYNKNHPAVAKLFIGFFFWIALALIVIVGGELFTGNLLYMTLARVYNKVSTFDCIRNWTLVFFGNYIACGLGACVLGYLTEFFSDDPYHAWLMNTVIHKVEYDWNVAVLRGMGANWMVNTAVVFVVASQDQVSRIVSCFLCVFIFATIGYEHCIANQFYVSLGQMYGADIPLEDFLYTNLIPVALGNYIGGPLFCGTGLFLMNYTMDTSDAPVKDSFIIPKDLLKSLHKYIDREIEDDLHVVASYRKKFLCKSGDVVSLLVDSVVELDEDKKPVRLLAELTKKELSGHLIINWNGKFTIEESQIIGADKFMCQILGYTPEELGKMTINQITYSNDTMLATNAVNQAMRLHTMKYVSRFSSI